MVLVGVANQQARPVARVSSTFAAVLQMLLTTRSWRLTVTEAAVFEQVAKTYPTGLVRSRAGRSRAARVTLTIRTGEVFGLLGPNRAGKTTLVKLLLSLAAPVRHHYPLGAPIADRGTLARVGYMHENHAFPRYLSAGELLAFYRWPLGHSIRTDSWPVSRACWSVSGSPTAGTSRSLASARAWCSGWVAQR